LLSFKGELLKNMKKIILICLIIGLSLVAATYVYAGFNYSSVGNYFLVDSVLKVGGDYLLVGEGLSGYCDNSAYINQTQCELADSTWNQTLSKIDEGGVESQSDSFFAVSNNLIFLSPDGEFISGVRKMNNNEFSTNAITISSSSKNLEISPQPNVADLNLKTNRILVVNDLVSSQGISFNSDYTNVINPNSLYSNQVMAQELNVIDDSQIIVPTENKITLTSGGNATASRILVGGADMCQKITWNTNQDITNVGRTGCGAGAGCDIALSSPGSTCMGGLTASTTRRTCCPDGYFVFDLDANAASIICCRAN